MTDRPRTVIAIDGPAASGKSSTAQWVAERLQFRHVDSGSLYRGITAAMLRTSTVPEQWTGPALVAQGLHVALRPEKTSFSILLDGEPSEPELRGSRVTEHVSLVARMPEVREWVNARVRDSAAEHDVVRTTQVRLVQRPPQLDGDGIVSVRPAARAHVSLRTPARLRAIAISSARA